MQRQARLFAITEYLRGRRTGITADELAERFEVTVRTIYRDLDTLREARLPLAAERGRGGGYALDRAYTLPPVNFDAREAALLLTLGRYAQQMRLLPFTGTLDGALEKVRAALSASAQRELLTVMEAFEFVGVPAHTAPKDVRVAIEQAWFEQRAVQIRYRDRENVTTERLIRLKRVLFERSMVILVCDDLTRGAERNLRLDRVEAARLV